MTKEILIVASSYYREITDNLIEGSTKLLNENNFDYDVLLAPGCFEIPFIINTNIEKYSAFISMWAI